MRQTHEGRGGWIWVLDAVDTPPDELIKEPNDAQVQIISARVGITCKHSPKVWVFLSHEEW